MKRLLLVLAAGLTVVALAGAVGLPDLAGAQDAPEATDSITVTGVGTVNAVPDEAQMSFGVETRGTTARAAVSANADAARRVINALRQAGARELRTEYVSVYPVHGETGPSPGIPLPTPCRPSPTSATLRERWTPPSERARTRSPAPA